MSETRPPYVTATAPINHIAEPFEIEAWERNLLLRMRQVAHSGQMIVVDGDARCWFVVGRLECNKPDKSELPFRI